MLNYRAQLQGPSLSRVTDCQFGSPSVNAFEKQVGQSGSLVELKAQVNQSSGERCFKAILRETMLRYGKLLFFLWSQASPILYPFSAHVSHLGLLFQHLDTGRLQPLLSSIGYGASPSALPVWGCLGWCPLFPLSSPKSYDHFFF